MMRSAGENLRSRSVFRCGERCLDRRFRRVDELPKLFGIVGRLHFVQHRSDILLGNFDTLSFCSWPLASELFSVMQRAGAEAERFGSRLASYRALNLKLDSLTGLAGRWYGIIGAWRHKPTISM